VVEDNFLNRKLVSFMLKDLGFEYQISTNGKLAIEKLKKEKFDLILMDVQMPEMNGYEATSYIRDQLKLDIPIIAMSGFNLDSEIEKCLSVGMTNYIRKPIKEEVLNKLIWESLAPKDVATV